MRDPPTRPRLKLEGGVIPRLRIFIESHCSLRAIAQSAMNTWQRLRTYSVGAGACPINMRERASETGAPRSALLQRVSNLPTIVGFAGKILCICRLCREAYVGYRWYSLYSTNGFLNRRSHVRVMPGSPFFFPPRSLKPRSAQSACDIRLVSRRRDGRRHGATCPRRRSRNAGPPAWAVRFQAPAGASPH